MRSGLVRSLVFWYSVIVFATFGVLNLAVSGMIGSSNEKNIEADLRGFQESSEVFLSRYVLKTAFGDIRRWAIAFALCWAAT